MTAARCGYLRTPLISPDMRGIQFPFQGSNQTEIDPDDCTQRKGSTMSETTSETPVLDLLASMTEDSVSASSLDDETFMLVRLAALVAVDAPSVSYLLNLAVAGELNIAELEEAEEGDAEETDEGGAEDAGEGGAQDAYEGDTEETDEGGAEEGDAEEAEEGDAEGAEEGEAEETETAEKG